MGLFLNPIAKAIAVCSKHMRKSNTVTAGVDALWVKSESKMNKNRKIWVVFVLTAGRLVCFIY